MLNNTLVNLEEWVEQKQADPVAHLQRQATEILLTSISQIPLLHDHLFLKGGILMSVLFDSARQTSDVDFTTDMAPEDEVPAHIIDALNQRFEITSTKLGYTDIVCKIQGYKTQPKKRGLSGGSWPAIKANLAFAKIDSAQHKRLKKGNCTNIMSIDISFREPVDAIQIMQINTSGNDIKAYSLIDVLAEKLRAILQQPIRNRTRRQDIYDVAHLINYFPLSAEEQAHLQKTLIQKCKARHFTPDKKGLANWEVRKRSESEWDNMKAELDDPLPDFNQTYNQVQTFYESLPW